MAVATTDFYIRPEDDWVLVATDPTFLNVRPSGFHPWWVAVTAGGAPAGTVEGQQFGRGSEAVREPFVLPGGITGEVYIRIKDPVAARPTDQKAHFGVIAVTA